MQTSIKEKVKELEKKSRLISENLIDAVWVVDAETLKIDYVTPSFERISGYTSAEWIGSHINVFLDLVSLKTCMSIIETGIKEFLRGEKKVHTMELKFNHKKRSVYWAELRGTIAKEGKRKLKLVGVIKDITVKKRADLKIENLNKKLTIALADKEKLLQKIKVLKKLLPICSSCKRIRDDNDKWWPLEAYIREHTDSEITHTICPDCRDVIYPDL